MSGYQISDGDNTESQKRVEDQERDESQKRTDQLIADAVHIPSREFPVVPATITLRECIEILANYPANLFVVIDNIVWCKPENLLAHLSDGVMMSDWAEVSITKDVSPDPAVHGPQVVGTLRIACPTALIDAAGDVHYGQHGIWDGSFTLPIAIIGGAITLPDGIVGVL